MSTAPNMPQTALSAAVGTALPKTPTPPVEVRCVGDIPDSGVSPTDDEVAAVVRAMRDSISLMEGRVALQRWAQDHGGSPYFGTGLDVAGGADHG